MQDRITVCKQKFAMCNIEIHYVKHRINMYKIEILLCETQIFTMCKIEILICATQKFAMYNIELLCARLKFTMCKIEILICANRNLLC